ncbi:tRNA (cytidine(34)-2'-O)-methyltransferase [Campylobacter sp. 19-13652]|uniref:tRNA (cytidine(34)-2'-O)-methyltransferase n=1 Tax=Campylobacter sp. 19-13652 TaxID=2840180 RepID=UPI001C74C6A9|nr:tRNA (cytidine(34)-2'-O)-methyltransferase [Campylobacter sp. 19-13652]BCX79124.1 tRNA (cytidine(34)-2'-O)-methyltransferase [Campylobacter sp. 19-13652]
MFNIVLVNPQIPQNTGAIGRMCVNAGFRLHIIKPTVFDLSQKAVRRAGLDYWHKLNPIIWENLEEFLAKNNQVKDRFFFASTKASEYYFNVKFKPNDFIFFGAESTGLPLSLMSLNPQNMVKIPMTKEGRSLNQAMAAGIISYEALRQNMGENPEIYM